MGGSTWSWERNAPALASAGYKVIAVDIPPFAFSDKNLKLSQSAGARADYLWKFVESIDPGKQWHLMGHSMGGGVAQAMAILHPEKVLKVIFVDPALFTDTEMKGPRNMGILKFKPFEVLAAGIGKAILINPRGVKKFLTSAFGTAPDSADLAEYLRALEVKGTARAMIRGSSGSTNPIPLNGRDFKSDALAIWGDKDTWIPVETMKPLLKHFPTIILSIIQNAGHCPMTTHPTEFNTLILNYLKSK
jgi:pimeloyl-ACP methyl ester carboxylesterase